MTERPTAASGSTTPPVPTGARIGCAGWSIPGALAERFPRRGTHLERYGAVFDAVEIDSSFRSLSYFRLHGTPRMYYSEYAASSLEALATRLENACRLSQAVWCIFDNTALGAAPANALALRAMLRDDRRKPPSLNRSRSAAPATGMRP